MSTFLVTGSSRGIGLGLVRQLAAKPTEDVGTIFAAARSSSSPDFQQLLEQYPGRIQYIPLDVTSQESVVGAVQLVIQSLDGKGLDVLINNAAIMHLGSVLEMDDLEQTFQVNVSGTHRVTRAFVPLMRNGEKKKILNMSSNVGSFTLQPECKDFPNPSYAISKAALNMLTVRYSQELEKEGFTVFCMNPGWVSTNMGGPAADLTPETSAGSILDTLFRAGPHENGKFINVQVSKSEKHLGEYSGGELPW